jgi:Zn-finger nucleic acid-binding protein
MEKPASPCPACREVGLRPEEHRGVTWLACPECEGVFVTEGDMATYIERRTQSQAIAHAFLKTLRESILQDHEDAVRLRRCVRCDEELERMGFGEHPFSIIDRCADHGLWLDDGDFDKVVRQARADARLHAEEDVGGQRGPTRSYTSSMTKDPLVCPNCGKRFPLTDADERCDDCNVALYTDA